MFNQVFIITIFLLIKYSLSFPLLSLVLPCFYITFHYLLSIFSCPSFMFSLSAFSSFHFYFPVLPTLLSHFINFLYLFFSCSYLPFFLFFFLYRVTSHSLIFICVFSVLYQFVFILSIASSFYLHIHHIKLSSFLSF